MKKLYVQEVDTHINPSNGQSKPIGVIASDNKEYLLKTQTVRIPKKGIVEEDASFVQEVIAYELSKELDIPVPNYAILEVEKEFLEDNRNYTFQHNIISPGLYFGSEYFSNNQNKIIENYEFEEILGVRHAGKKITSLFNVSNKEAYTDIIALDCLLLNGDRFTNIGNLIIATLEKNIRKVYAIDFGHCFLSPFWNDEKKNLLEKLIMFPEKSDQFMKDFIKTIFFIGQNYYKTIGKTPNKHEIFGNVFSKMENYIYFDNKNPFSDIIQKIENISTAKIEKILYHVPDEWLIEGDYERKKYISFLSLNKFNVRKAIELMYKLNAFRHSIGDELKWPKEKIIGIQ